MGSPKPAAEHSVTVEKVQSWEALSTPAFRAEWESLVERARARSVFQTYVWNRAWWEVFGGDLAPYVLLLRRGTGDNRELIGIAPFVLSGLLSGSKDLAWIGGTNFASDYCDLILREDVSASELGILCEVLLSRRGSEWTRLDAVNVPQGSLFLELRTPYLSRDFQIDAPARILGNVAEDQKALNKKSLKRHYAYFQKAGKLEFRHFETASDIERHLEPFFDQHIARRAITGTPSLFLDPREKDFYRRVARAFLEIGYLRFSGVFLDDRAIAYHFGFEFDRKYIWYKPSFDVALLKKSPGEVLLKYLLEYSISRNLAEFDFTVGDEDFKYRFANVVRTCDRLRIFSGSVSYGWFNGKKLLKRLLGRLPRTRTPLVSE